MNLIKSIKIKLLKIIIRLLLDLSQVNLIVSIFSILLIKQKKNKDCKTLLALIPSKFRGDLKILSEKKKFSVIELEEEWLIIFMDYFYPLEVKPKNLYNNEQKTLKFQKKYHIFLKSFLKKFFLKNEISAVITADVRYTNTIDFCTISSKLRVPWIVLHRENLYACQSVFNFAKARHSRFKNFTGDRIIVHNLATKKMFVNSGFVSGQKVDVAGCLRMDKWKKYLSNKQKRVSKKKITLFSYVLWRHTPYPEKIFSKTHEMFIKFANENPDIRCVIRPKEIFLEKTDWQEKIDRCNYRITDRKYFPNNLVIDSKTDTHQLIKESIFVVGLNSTVLLEAAIANIPVIIPYFDEIRKTEYNSKIYFFDSLDCFDLPKNEYEMFKMFEYRINNSQINKKIENKRKFLFEKYVSKFNVNSLKIYSQLINKEINQIK